MDYRISYFQYFPPTLWTQGGGEVQLRNTLSIMRGKGLSIDCFDVWNPGKEYDIMHVFGSTYQLSDFVVISKALGMKVVVSTIAYTDKKHWKFWAWSLIDRLMPLPNIYTYRKRIYDTADILVAASEAEKNQIVRNFYLDESKFRVIPLGINSEMAEIGPDLFKREYGLRDFVLEVGRISTHKGQARLIEALKGTGLDLVLIGDIMPDDENIKKEFQELVRVNEWVHYLGSIPNNTDLLASAFAAAKVHVLPSYGESTGIVNLEAAACGANVVSVRNEPIYEYLGEEPIYCNPLSIESIREAVIEAVARPRQTALKDKVLEEFTWESVSKKLYTVYEELMIS